METLALFKFCSSTTDLKPLANAAHQLYFCQFERRFIKILPHCKFSIYYLREFVPKSFSFISCCRTSQIKTRVMQQLCITCVVVTHLLTQLLICMLIKLSYHFTVKFYVNYNILWFQQNKIFHKEQTFLQFLAPYWISNCAHTITRLGIFQTADLSTFHVLMYFSMQFLPLKWFFKTTTWKFHHKMTFRNSQQKISGRF